jgi:hypothetical protein
VPTVGEAKKAPALAAKVPRPPKQVAKKEGDTPVKRGNNIQGFPKKKSGVETLAQRADEKNGQRQE